VKHEELVDKVNCQSQKENPRDILPAFFYQCPARRAPSKDGPQVTGPACACIAEAGSNSNHTHNQWL